MLLADVTFSDAGVLVITGLVGTLAGVIGLLFRLLQTSNQAQLSEAKMERDVYRQLAWEMVTLVEHKAGTNPYGPHISDPIPAVIPPAVMSPELPRVRGIVADLAIVRARIQSALEALPENGGEHP